MSEILIVTPVGSGSRRGNRVTAERYARLLRAEGHGVSVAEAFEDQACDVLFALHARRSAPSIRRYREARPTAPLIVVLTGTDLYRDLPAGDADALASLELADRLIVLHPRGAEDLPEAVRGKVQTAVQSVETVEDPAEPETNTFQVCVLGHLRGVKDPLRAALAARDLPEKSKVRIVHVGGILEPELQAAVEREQAENPRYRYLGELPHDDAKAILAGSKLHVLSSHMEGGANALTEAIAHGVPTLASRIKSSVGLLGPGYPGFFEAGDTAQLTELLRKAEKNSGFRLGLQRWCQELLGLVSEENERSCLRRALRDVLEGRTGAVRIVDRDVPESTFAADVRAGLTAKAKHLHCRYFYDEVGSQLFEEICALPEYYPTRAEAEILRAHAADLPPRFAHQTVLFELGSGSGEKTDLLIKAFLDAGRELTYVPVDISRSALEASAHALNEAHPALRVVGIAGEYGDGIRWIAEHPTRERLVAYLGSNIGNFDRDAAVTFLLSLRSAMNPRDALLIGIDLRKAPGVLVAAYDDAQGVTARFNKNVLTRINAELGGSFDPDAFDHVARYDTGTGRVSMHLISKREQSVRIDALDLDVAFTAGEEIHTEDSYKYSPEEIAFLAEAAGFRVAEQWFDGEQRFSLNLFAPDP